MLMKMMFKEGGGGDEEASERKVKVSQVRGQSRVKDTVTRSPRRINGSMLLCANIYGWCDGLH